MDGSYSQSDLAESDSDVARLIDEARNGSSDSLGRLMQRYRPYLLLMVGGELTPDLVVKMSDSDVVQETVAGACADFAAFRGGTEEELTAWLRQILLHRLTSVARRYRNHKRNVGRERVVDLNGVAKQQLTPSGQSLAREKVEQLERAIARLPDRFREVIILRNRQDHPFAVIAVKMNRSVEAVRKLWARAVQKLQEELGADEQYHPRRPP